MGLRSHSAASDMAVEIEIEWESGREKERKIAWQFPTRSLFRFCSHEITNPRLVLLHWMKQNMFRKLSILFISTLQAFISGQEGRWER